MQKCRNRFFLYAASLMLISTSGLCADAATYQLAVIDVPMTCNSYLTYTIPKDRVTAKTAVALYQLIRFAYANEELTDERNNFYKTQFGYNPSDIRINRYNGSYTIIPLTVSDMAQALDFPLPGDNTANDYYKNTDIAFQYRADIQKILDFRATYNTLDNDPEQVFSIAKTLLEPLLTGYKISIKPGEGQC